MRVVQFADSDEEGGRWWIEELNLKSDDYYCLCNGLHISDRVVNASQQLMRQQFEKLVGFKTHFLDKI